MRHMAVVGFIRLSYTYFFNYKSLFNDILRSNIFSESGEREGR